MMKHLEAKDVEKNFKKHTICTENLFSVRARINMISRLMEFSLYSFGKLFSSVQMIKMFK